jgi:hypothetical protein
MRIADKKEMAKTSQLFYAPESADTIAGKRFSKKKNYFRTNRSGYSKETGCV